MAGTKVQRPKHEAIGLTEEETAISRAVWQSLFPSPLWIDTYVGRTVWGYEDLEILAVARDLQRNVLIPGPTGAGKSHFFRAFGAREGTAIATVSCHGASDPALWFGDFRHLRGEWLWVDGIITAVARWGGLGFFDEINFLRADIAASVHSAFRERELVLERKGNEVVQFADDALVVGAYNPGYEGTSDLNEALKNRFAITLPWDYDAKVERKLVSNVCLLKVADHLRQALAEGLIETPVSTNSLQEFEELAASFDTQFATANFVARFLPEERPTVTNILELEKVESTFVVPETVEL